MEEQNNEVYEPRPMWQVWLARVALVVVLIGVGLWLYQIAFPL